MTPEQFIDATLIDGPMKATEVVTAFTVANIENKWRIDDVIDYLNNLINRNGILEVEYVTPNMDYKIKSLYFHKDCKVRIFNLR